MWIVPSRGRPHNIERLLSKVTTPGIVAIDDDQAWLYSGVELPPNWTIVSSPRSRFGPKSNEIFERFRDEPWYGTINDDMLPESDGWDEELLRHVGNFGIAYASDCFNSRAGCVAFGGDLIRALGWLCCPVLEHFYNDDVHEMLIAEFGGVYCEHVKVPHMHYSNGKANMDKTYKERPPIEKDRERFKAWVADEWPAVKARVRAAC